MNGLRRPLRAGLCAAILIGVLAGHVRLRNPANDRPLEWAHPRVPLVLQLDGSDDVPGPSDDAALRLALQEWSGLDGSLLELVEDTDPAQRERRDWWDTGLHMLLFDEDGGTGWFVGGGIVAITPIVFRADGRIVDADVLFNGRDHRFTTSGEPGAFDVQAIATHELGHVAGLDHSGWAGSAMYPWVEPADHVARSLSEDELGGARAVYGRERFATISGHVVRAADATPVEGAHVTARDAAGRPRRSVLSDEEGSFALGGLDAGRYVLHVAPLEGPVDGLSLFGGRTIDTDFQAHVDIGPVDVARGASTSVGVLAVDPDGPLLLGRERDSLPVRLVAGRSAGATLRGVGLVEGSTLRTSDPDLVVQHVDWNGGSVAFRIAVPFGEAPGHVDLVVEAPDGETAVLTSALEITPEAPAVATVTPDAAGARGGSELVITGQGFRADCRVVIGDRIYREGLPGGAQLQPDGALTLTLGATVEGLHDVVVIDRTGVEGRLADGLLVDDRPVVEAVWPRAGYAGGGTRVRVMGSGFASDTRVLLDGVEQDAVQVVDGTKLEFTTRAGAEGVRALAVVDADGTGEEVAFRLTAAPDPALEAIDPGVGARGGAETIELAGRHLDPGCRVRFDVDPATGEGGVEAEVLDGPGGTRLVVVTPGLADDGPVAVAVEDPASGQASLLVGGFEVRDDGAAGGGGCASVRVPPDGPGGALGAGAWLLALFGVVFAWSLRSRRELKRA